MVVVVETEREDITDSRHNKREVRTAVDLAKHLLAPTTFHLWHLDCFRLQAAFFLEAEKENRSLLEVTYNICIPYDYNTELNRVVMERE